MKQEIEITKFYFWMCLSPCIGAVIAIPCAFIFQRIFEG